MLNLGTHGFLSLFGLFLSIYGSVIVLWGGRLDKSIVSLPDGPALDTSGLTQEILINRNVSKVAFGFLLAGFSLQSLSVISFAYSPGKPLGIGFAEFLQLGSYGATIAMAITAVVMIFYAKDEKRKAHDALVMAKEALDRAEQIAGQIDKLHYAAFLSDESDTKAGLSGLVLVASELKELGSPNADDIHDFFTKERAKSVKRYDEFKKTRGAELGIE